MRKNILSLFVVAFIACTFTTKGLMAQTTKYNWTKYSVSFSVPSTHTIKQNTADVFESGDANTWIEMYPYEDASETALGMVQKVASNGGFTIEGEGAYESGGYDGYWIRCNTSKHPTWSFWIIGFIDPNSSTNFYTIIWWKKGDQAAKDIASNMSYSFERIK